MLNIYEDHPTDQPFIHEEFDRWRIEMDWARNEHNQLEGVNDGDIAIVCQLAAFKDRWCLCLQHLVLMARHNELLEMQIERNL